MKMCDKSVDVQLCRAHDGSIPTQLDDAALAHQQVSGNDSDLIEITDCLGIPGFRHERIDRADYIPTGVIDCLDNI